MITGGALTAPLGLPLFLDSTRDHSSFPSEGCCNTSKAWGRPCETHFPDWVTEAQSLEARGQLGCWWEVKQGDWEADHWATPVATPGSAGLGVSTQTLSAGAFPLTPSPGLPGVTQARYRLF